MNLNASIAAIIIEKLELEDRAPEDFRMDAPLFEPKPVGFGFDSLAALEIMAGLSETFGHPFHDVERADMTSVNTLAEYVRRVGPLGKGDSGTSDGAIARGEAALT